MQGFPDREAARARDFIKVYELIPALGLPFCGPDRAAFYFIDNKPPEVNRASVTAARQVLGETFGVTFGWKDIWSSNGPRREYKAHLPSGVELVLYAKKADMPQDEDAADVPAPREDTPKLEAVAA